MGLITDCIASGFPDRQLISVAPPHVTYRKRIKNERGEAVDKAVESTGKEVGVPLYGGLWGAAKWAGGMDEDIRAKADAAGCNVGLILGEPSLELKGYAFVAIDIDLMEVGDSIPETQMCDLLERALCAAYAVQSHEDQSKRYVCWVRKTRLFRATILARLPVETLPGSKYKVTYQPFDSSTSEPLLKPLEIDQPIEKQTHESRIIKHNFEFLTKGQYTVIAGQHYSGTEIYWYRSDAPFNKFSIPEITPESVPAFGSWEDFLNISLSAINSVVQDPDCPVANLLTSNRTAKIKPAIERAALSNSELAAPSAATLIRLINLMPNPEWVDYDLYCAIMIAVGGARMGLLKQKMLTVEDDESIANAAAEWASKWQGPNPLNYEEALLKCQSDWFHQSSYRIGWGQLTAYATQLGADTSSILMEEAQNAFTAESNNGSIAAPPTGLNWDSHAEHLLSDKGEFTEFWYASQFCAYAQGRIKWLPDTQSWMIWHPSKGGWFTTNADNWVREQIQTCLQHIVNSTGRISRDDAKNILSSHMVNNVEKIVRDRVVQDRTVLNDAPWYLQTPDGAYDLRSGAIIPLLQQRNNLDTRYTSCGAKAGFMPLWNSLLFHLADDNEDTAEWLKYYAAYSLIGDPSAHRMLFIHGPGNNGKSTFLNVLAGIFGGYAGMIERDVWLERGADKHPASLFRIRDVRLAYTSEMPPSESWNESRLKAVTGQDLVEARGMHKDPVIFRARAALLMVGQTIPTFRKVDTSISRRMAIVGTTRTPKKVIQKLGERIIAEEGPAILHDLIRRCSDLAKMESRLPEMTSAMQMEIKDYLDKSDAAFAWVSAECIVGNDAEGVVTPIKVLQDRYTAFLRRRGGDGAGGDTLSQMVQVSDEQFIKELRRLGVRFKGADNGPLMTNQGPAVEGIKLKLSLAA